MLPSDPRFPTHHEGGAQGGTASSTPENGRWPGRVQKFGQEGEPRESADEVVGRGEESEEPGEEEGAEEE